MYSCTKCSYSSKYRANVARHTSKCKGEKGEKGLFIYSCPVCSAYTTDKKANLERHQASDLCKTKAEEKAQTNLTLEQEVQQLKRELEVERKRTDKILEILAKRFKIQEEIH